MEGNPGVGEPRGAGVSETVSGEVRQAEVSNNLIPTGRITNGGRREETATWTDEEWFVRLLERAESFQDRPEWVENRHATLFAALGWFGDEAAPAGEDLSSDDDEVLCEVHVSDLKSGDFGRTCCQQSGEHHEV